MASTDDGLTSMTTPAADGTFVLSLEPARVWSIELLAPDGGTTKLAVPRQGHFDRGFDVEASIDESLGRVWPPLPDVALRLLPEGASGGCVEGFLPDGSACVVSEVFTQCPDGPPRPLDDPQSLLLGVGLLADLPGASRGTRYVVPARVPQPVFWACNLTPTAPP